MAIKNKKWWVRWLTNGIRLSDSEENTLHVVFATKKDFELLTHIASTMNAMDDVKKICTESRKLGLDGSLRLRLQTVLDTMNVL